MTQKQKQQALPIGMIMKWWEDLDKQRGDRAELRRCRSPAEVAFVPAFYRLKVMMPESVDAMQLAAVAGVLSHVETHLEGTARTAELFARPKEGGSTPRVSEPRFRRLCVPDYGYDELYPMMTRLSVETDRRRTFKPDRRRLLVEQRRSEGGRSRITNILQELKK